jgi:hypothetical protein
MPIDYQIDHERRLVLAKGTGTFSDQDVFNYQREVWSRPELAGYDELMDMTEVEHIEIPTTNRLTQLAEIAARMDAPARESRFAIVAPEDLAFGLARMYQIHRSLEGHSTKRVGVFRSTDEAMAFLAEGWSSAFRRRGGPPEGGTPTGPP